MLGMPVENQAVARSPQAMAIAGAEPPSKSTRRQLCAGKRAGAIRHDRDIGKRRRRRRCVAQIKDLGGETKFGRQLLDCTSAPTG